MQSRRLGLLVIALMIVVGTVMFSRQSAVAGDPCFDVSQSSRGVSTAGAGSGGGVINGTPRADTIVVNGDNYVVNAGSGDDTICVYGENNVVYGGPGRDDIYGQTSAYGEAGNDYINVWGASVVDGGPGNDFIYFEDVNEVSGGSGGDTIYGEGAATVYGNAGSDYVDVASVGLLDCGAAYDEIYTIDVDEVVNCEAEESPA